MINIKSRKKRLLSIFTAAFMALFASGESLRVFADRADSVEQIKNVTGDSEKYAELLDVPDADDKFLGMAGDFTIFVKDKFVIPLESADIEGRLAAGKGIENQRGTYDIGSRYTGNGATVITGGGTVEDILPAPANGAERRIFAVSSDTDVNTTVYGKYLDNFYIADGLIDFDAEFSKLEKLSKEISNYEVTGKTEELYGSYKLIGSDSEVNVFTLSEEEWSGFSKSNYIQIFVPNKIMDSYVIINVPGSEVSMPNYSVEFVQYEADADGNPVMENGQIKILDKINVKQDSKKEDGTFDDEMLLCGHILYNAYEAEDVGYTGSIQGSLLAVNANVHGELGGHVSGSTIAKSAEGFGIEAGSITFNPPKRIITKVSELTVSKTDIAKTDEVSGAKLMITLKQPADEKNADLLTAAESNDRVSVEEGSDNRKITWVSGDEPVVIKGLPDGNYLIEEIAAPDGYTITGSVEFDIKDGVVSSSAATVPGPDDNTVDSENSRITMVDAPSEVHIKKTDTAGKEIPGAKLILKLVKSSETGADLLSSDVEGGASEVVITADSVSFVSGETETVVKSIPDGDYTLTEIQAPEGYETAETISFTVENGKVVDSEDDTVTMVDEIIVTTTVTTTITTTETTATTPVTTTAATTTTPVTTTVTTTTTPVTTTEATTTTPVTTTEATTTTPVTTTVTTTTIPVTTTETTTTTEETTTTAGISMPEFTFSMPEQNTGIPESDVTFTLATTTAETTVAETTPSDTTSPSVSTSPALTAKTVSSTPKTGDGGRTAALMIMLGSAAAMVLVRKRKD